ncbi:AAA-domain-containing protein [Violaceomyces palustris]|uniref:AAA-domain-containing protein n=1 Tax=Violaceomyces palustris TaxID=1673888 RepID=A0ACD0NWA3_9BASI|nr:AAA-domain-containing protein [Violaceomyces palustris]
MNQSYMKRLRQSTRNNLSLNGPLPGSPSNLASTSAIAQTPTPPPGSAAAAALARAEQQALHELEHGSDTTAPATPTLDTQQAAALSPPPSAPRTRQSSPSLQTNSSKRKSRSSRPDGITSSLVAKRSKSSRQPTSQKYEPPATRLSDLGGIASSIEKVLELIAMPLCHPEIYSHTGVKPPRGVLLHGPPGCGKTMLAGALAGELSVPFLSISAPSIVSGTSGESEKTLRDTFEEAASIAPCILFIDEIDAITPKRETAQREMERRIVAQLLTCLDDLSWEKTDGKPVMIIGATNRPDSLDPALRRAGRFDHEIAMGVPDEDGREQILRVLASKLRLAGDFDFRALAKATPGYVGADLTALTGAAGIIAVKRIFQELGVDLPAEEKEPAQIDAVRDEQVTTPADTPASQAEASPDVEMRMDEDSIASTQAATTSEDPVPPVPVAESGLEGEAAPSSGPPKVSSSVQPSSSFFDSLPESLRTSSIATFLRTHPLPLSATQLEPLAISNEDFVAALPSVQPSSKREGFATVPDVTWSDVGALHDTREELSMAIVQPIRRPELFKAVGVSASSGVLLWGPPGCGKTLLAKAVANESRANFISVKGPELLNKYVGESEKAVRQVFARARTSSPCVIFFDELDALVPRRDDALSESSSRVVNTLLTELDGLESRVQTYVIAATNRPDMIDPAMCRPGRLDKLLYVDLPTCEERFEILKTLTKKTPMLDGSQVDREDRSQVVDLWKISQDPRCEGFSGADLAALTREAAVSALKETIQFSISLEEGGEELSGGSKKDKAGETKPRSSPPKVLVNHLHFLKALEKVQPSVSIAQRRKYSNLRNRLSGLPTGRHRLDSNADGRRKDEGEEDAAADNKSGSNEPNDREGMITN